MLDLTSEQLAVIRGGIIMENVDRNPATVTEVDAMATEQEDAKMAVDMPNATTSAPAPHTEQPSPVKAAPAKDESWEYIRNMRTDYALNRPQRAATRNRRVQMGSTSESIQLVECEEFMNAASDGEGIEQPFTIDITAEALFLMDFHAHLSEFEVIGLLAGKWDADRRHLSIREAIPCQRAQGSETRTSVELDPASEVQARSEMVEKGLVGSGWYHSHPVFSATPSLKDIENQRNYQTLFRREDSHVEPFVGWIISPYDPLLPSPISRMCGFFVLERSQGIKPFRLKSFAIFSLYVSYLGSLRFDVVHRLAEISPNLLYTCERVLQMTKSESGRMELTATWREWTSVKEEQQTGGPLRKFDKMKLSLMSYFEDSQADGAQELGEALERKIEETWGVTLTERKTEIPTEETITDAKM